MLVELKVPPVGESITEVAVGEWMKAEGAFVKQDEPVCVVETDKVNLEVPAPVSGVITRVLKKQGDSAKIGDVLAEITPGQDPKAAPAAPAATPAPTAAPATATPAPTAAPATAPPSTAAPVATPPAKGKAGEARVMPAAARVLGEAGLAASAAEGTGPGGRVTKEDAIRAVSAVSETPAVTSTPEPTARPPQALGESERDEELVPMTHLRQTVARRLVEAQQTAALLTTFNEVDMSAVMALRGEHKESYEERYGIKLGFMSFFVKAVVDALRLFPAVNAEIRDKAIAYRHYCDIGIAVGGGKGLVVPVLRHAERMSFAEIERQISDLGKRAKENKLKLDELTGGTFSITNGGIYGSLLSTPIVNPPQSGILGMHAIQDRPVALDGQVVIRPMMYIALTYDHRIIDGREAVGFLKRVKTCVESPVRMLLEV